MRSGFTTGSCAAAASKAAAYMLLFEKEKKKISIETPKGIDYEAEILDIKREKECVSCAVKKNSGDDPDVTNGMLIYSSVSVIKEADENAGASVYIDGGEGVGRVTMPGLDQPVGNAAINHVPREMITKEVLEVCRLADFKGSLKVIISAKGGEEIAKKTFNPRLGIIGGISIIGTSGIVEPMSTKALIDTIRVELLQKKAQGYRCAAISPGNYGIDFMKERYGYDLDKSVKCSNFIGDTIDIAAEAGFEAMLLTGNIGKLVKTAGGIMNTHSREADCRMEILAAAAIRAGVDSADVLRILDCIVTDEALEIINDAGKLGETMKLLLDKIMFYLEKRAAGRIEMQCIVYSNRFGELAKSEGAEKWLISLERDPVLRI